MSLSLLQVERLCEEARQAYVAATGPDVTREAEAFWYLKGLAAGMTGQLDGAPTFHFHYLAWKMGLADGRADASR